MRRVVVTGLGMVTPLGCGVEHTWQRLVTGQSGVRRVERFDVSDLPARIAGQIPRGDGSSGTYNPTNGWSRRSNARSMSSSSSRCARPSRRSTMRLGSRRPTTTRS